MADAEDHGSDSLMLELRGVREPRDLLALLLKRFERAHGPAAYVEVVLGEGGPGGYHVTRFRDDDGVERLPVGEPCEVGDRPRVEGGVLGTIVRGPAELRVMVGLQIDASDPYASWLRGYQSLAAVPIHLMKTPAWVVFLFRGDAPDFGQLAESLVYQVNMFAAMAESTRLTRALVAAQATADREIAAVGRIQRALLPAPGQRVPGMDVAMYFEPCALAGGDLIDFARLPDGTWGLLIADASGHGVSAAVVVAMLSATLRAFRPTSTDVESARRVSEVMAFANTHLCEKPLDGSFVTAFLGIWDPGSRRLEYCRAGHPPPLLCRAGGITQLSDGAALPLGIMKETEYTTASVRLEPGDQLVLYTDGVTEAMNERGEMFGTDRLLSAAESHRDAQETLGSIQRGLGAFVGTCAPNDDRAVAVFRVVNQAAPFPRAL